MRVHRVSAAGCITLLALVAVPRTATPESVADVPDLGPFEIVEPSCGNRTEVGCCYREGSETAVSWCDGTLPEARSCNLWFWRGGCGWNASAGRYDCFGSGKDPSGTHPWSCGWDPECIPDCADRKCGSDGCGGSCGTCGNGMRCESGGQCRSGDPCFGYPATSCCDNEMAIRCVDGSIEAEDCTRDEKPCGWSAEANRYICGGNGDDPSGLAHRECAVYLTPEPEPEAGPDAAGGEDVGKDSTPGTTDVLVPPSADTPTDSSQDADATTDAGGSSSGSGSCSASTTGGPGGLWLALVPLLWAWHRAARRREARWGACGSADQPVRTQR